MATITWKTKPEDATGIFSFACFFSVPLPPKKEAYLEGLARYRDICKMAEWEGWQIVVYTDKATLDESISLGKNAAQNEAVNEYRRALNAIFTDPIFHIAEVKWPEATDEKGKLDWRKLICFRYKAFDDFPDIPVLVRDSDTIFLNKDSHVYLTAEQISDWELAYLEGLRKTGTPFSLSSTPNYRRKNLGCKNGFFGGTVGSLGGIPEWADGTLWTSCMAYIVNPENTPDGNTRPPLDVGILVYVIYPKLKDRTFLFRYDFPDVVTTDYVRGQFALESHTRFLDFFSGGSRKKKVKRRRTKKRKSPRSRK
jgi:hypothetical protein